MFVEDVGRHNAVDAIAGRMWLDGIDGARQDLLHHRPPHLRDGDQGGADGHSVPRLALGPHADGPRDRAEGRHHDDRPRDQQALPAVHRRASGSRSRDDARRDGRSRAARSPASCSPAARAGAWAASTRDWSSSTGKPMVAHVLERLAPQVGAVLINANQNPSATRAFGYPVVADEVGGFAGPLAGLHAGLTRATTPLRRHRALRFAVPAARSRRAPRARRSSASDAELAVAQTGDQPHPVFALVRRDVLPHLAAFLARRRAQDRRVVRDAARRRSRVRRRGRRVPQHQHAPTNWRPPARGARAVTPMRLPRLAGARARPRQQLPADPAAGRGAPSCCSTATR